MADQATIEELVNYYTGLLIIQYATQPKAQAHIALIATTLLASAIYLDVLNGYDLDTAVGIQLDVLGKYQDVDRYYTEIDLENYFSYTSYSEVNPDALPKFGYSNYLNFGGYDYNGTLTYSDIVEEKNTLSDADFRTLIKLAIIQNTNDYSITGLDTAIFDLFGVTIHKESAQNMAMWYFIQDANTPLIQAIIAKKMLPSPMAVGLGIAFVNSLGTFGFANYQTGQPSFAYGFSTYANYGTLPGQILTYDNLQTG